MERSGGYLGQALQMLQDGISATAQTEMFAKSFIKRDAVGLAQTLVPMEKWKREQVLPELQNWAEILQQALVCRSGVQVLSAEAREMSVQRSSAELLQTLRKLQKAMEYLQSNVSPAAVCGWLEWALR